MRGTKAQRAAAPIRPVDIAVDGDPHSVLATDPKAIDDVIKIDVRKGSFANLGPNQIAVATDEADRKHLTVGSTVTVTYLNTGDHVVTVAAIYHPIGTAMLAPRTTARFFPSGMAHPPCGGRQGT